MSFAGARSFQEFSLSDDGKILDEHNLFYAHWSYYFVSLIVTILFELLLTLIFIKTLKGQFRKFLLVIVGINFISHPILWYLDSRIDVPLSVLELGVIIFESALLVIVYRKTLQTGNCIFYGILANLTSWLVGGIVSFLIYEYGRAHFW